MSGSVSTAPMPSITGGQIALPDSTGGPVDAFATLLSGLFHQPVPPGPGEAAAPFPPAALVATDPPPPVAQLLAAPSPAGDELAPGKDRPRLKKGSDMAAPVATMGDKQDVSASVPPWAGFVPVLAPSPPSRSAPVLDASSAQADPVSRPGGASSVQAALAPVTDGAPPVKQDAAPDAGSFHAQMSSLDQRPGKAPVEPAGAASPQPVAERLAPPFEPPVGSDIAPAGHTAPARAPPPADQLGPALVGIMTSPNGSQTVTVRLDPAELGVVHIRVIQTEAGVAHVDITAARPETLALLRGDQPRLQQALDQAGIPADGRSITFQISQPDHVGASASRPDSMAAGSGDGGHGGQGGGFGHPGGDPRQPAGGDPRAGQQRQPMRWFRTGLDITA